MDTPTPDPTFESLGLPDTLVDTLTELGYEAPTPIQAATIPHLLQGGDLLGQAATGTGKTAAFALPLIARLAEAPRGDGPRALILAPTRELAVQVADSIDRYSRSTRLRVLPVYGGQPIGVQIRALSQGIDVVVATPGRAVDHLQRQTLSLRDVRILVLDEADEMLDMGFADELDVVLSAIGAIDEGDEAPAADEEGEANAPETNLRQTVLFSATMPRHIQRLARKHLRDPVTVSLAREPVPEGERPQIRQIAYLARHSDKRGALVRVLDYEMPTSTLIFCRTRTDVDELSEGLARRGYRAQALHGGMSQEQRDRVIQRLRTGVADLVVATDVAARGLDVDVLTHVVNFDVPSSPASYVHRIGRVGRAGREGVAITLADPREQRLLQNIERLTRQPFVYAQIPSAHEVQGRRLEHTRDAVVALLDEEIDLAYREIAAELSAKRDPLQVAAAALRLAHEARVAPISNADREFPHLVPYHLRKERQRPDPRGGEGRREDRREGGSDRREGGPDRREGGPDRRNGAARRGGPMARIFVGMGRQLGVRPQDLFGAIINEAGLGRNEIGHIEIADRFSLVEVSAHTAEQVIDALRRTKIKGKRPKIGFDRNDGPAPRPRAPGRKFPRGKRK